MPYAFSTTSGSPARSAALSTSRRRDTTPSRGSPAIAIAPAARGDTRRCADDRRHRKKSDTSGRPRHDYGVGVHSCRLGRRRFQRRSHPSRHRGSRRLFGRRRSAASGHLNLPTPHHHTDMSVTDTNPPQTDRPARPTRLEIEDKSHRHIGHEGARPGGETHFAVTVRCQLPPFYRSEPRSPAAARLSGVGRRACDPYSRAVADDPRAGRG